jgi:hypothetical protein
MATPPRRKPPAPDHPWRRFFPAPWDAPPARNFYDDEPVPDLVELVELAERGLPAR